jgi:hypothetical protein
MQDYVLFMYAGDHKRRCGFMEIEYVGGYDGATRFKLSIDEFISREMFNFVDIKWQDVEFKFEDDEFIEFYFIYNNFSLSYLCIPHDTFLKLYSFTYFDRKGNEIEKKGNQFAVNDMDTCLSILNRERTFLATSREVNNKRMYTLVGAFYLLTRSGACNSNIARKLLKRICKYFKKIGKAYHS